MGWARVILALCVWCGAAVGARAEEPALRVSPAPVLEVGAHAVLVVQLAPVTLNDKPWMLTLSAEGAAVEVVRGRLLRGDEKPGPKGELLLEIPLLARDQGRTVVHLRFDGYECDPRCRPLRLEAVAVLEARR